VKVPSLLRELAADLMAAHLVAVVVIVMLVVQVLGATVSALESRDMREVAAEVVDSLSVDGNHGLQLHLSPQTAARFSPSYGRYIYAVLDADGRVLISSSGQTEAPAGLDPATSDDISFQSRHGSVWLFGVTLKGTVGSRPVWVQVAENMNHRDVLMDEVGDAVLFRVVWGVVPVYVVLVAIAMLRMKRRLRPLLLVSAEAARIGPAATATRLPEGNVPVEIRPLVTAVNTGLARLDHAFAAQREFLEDAAHELRTPLTVLRARVESLVDPAVRPALLDDIAIISRTVTQLLRVAELEGIGAGTRETVDLAALARAIAGYLTPMAAAAGKRIVVHGPDSLPYPGNSEALGQAINNLVENALFHAPADSEVDIVLSAAPSPTITVRDHGPGVPANERDLIFQRFWRRDRRRGTGAGLGLSIVGRAVELHGGHVAVGDAEGGGAVFTITLPVAEGTAANDGSAAGQA
jgi:signal transduction histidine kinase